MMDVATRAMVRRRAGERCEYCHLPQSQSPLAALQIEHIIPKKHGGVDDPGNLALACIDCNLHKGPNLTGIDPATRQITELFHPRRDNWHEHFRWEAIFIVGQTAIGRTSIEVLQMNSDVRLELRAAAGIEKE